MQATLHQNNSNTFTMVNHEGHIFTLTYELRGNKHEVRIKYNGKTEGGFTCNGTLLKHVPEFLRRVYYKLNRKNVLEYLASQSYHYGDKTA